MIKGEKLILKLLKKTSPIPISPLYIAQQTGLSINTVDVYLRNLLTQHKIKKMFRGNYTLEEKT